MLFLMLFLMLFDVVSKYIWVLLFLYLGDVVFILPDVVSDVV